MAEILILVDERTIQQVTTDLTNIKDGMRRAMRPAVAKTATTIRARISRLVASKLPLKSADIKKKIHVQFTDKSAVETGAKVTVSGRLTSLRHFKPIQNKQGVKVKLYKGDPAVLYRNSFLTGAGWKATRIHKPGIIGRLFHRKPHASIRELAQGLAFSRQSQRREQQVGNISKRLPLHRLMGPSAADGAMKSPGELQAVVAELGGVLEKNLLSQVDRLVSGALGGQFAGFIAEEG